MAVIAVMLRERRSVRDYVAIKARLEEDYGDYRRWVMVRHGRRGKEVLKYDEIPMPGHETDFIVGYDTEMLEGKKFLLFSEGSIPSRITEIKPPFVVIEPGIGRALVASKLVNGYYSHGSIIMDTGSEGYPGFSEALYGEWRVAVSNIPVMVTLDGVVEEVEFSDAMNKIIPSLS